MRELQRTARRATPQPLSRSMGEVITPTDPRIEKLTRRSFRAYTLMLDERVQNELRAAGLLRGEVVDVIYRARPKQLGAAVTP